MVMFNFKKRNAFDLTHDRKFTCKMGQAVPILCEECVPNDTWIGKTDLILRLSPLLAPVMHRVDVFTHFFFVPSRLLQDNWEKFITGGDDGMDDTVAPTIESPANTGWAPGSLADYLGEDTGVPNLHSFALPFRAYNKIWNDWYRDENLQEEVAMSKGDGVDVTTNTNILRRAWKKDYFTNALPWAQRGPSVTLPLGTEAPVEVFGTGKTLGLTNGTTNGALFESSGQDGTGTQSTIYGQQQGYDKDLGTAWSSGTGNAFGKNKLFLGVTTDSTKSGLAGKADLSTASAATINAIRQAFQLQKWFEINAISGSRYVEQILRHFGIHCGDARLGRSEFIGGGRSPILVTEVVQTSEGTSDSPQGNLAGHGFTASRSHTFKYTCPEHGYIIGIMSVMPLPSYQQGQRRMFARRTRYDFLWPVFSHLGNQEIKNKEIFAQGESVVDANGEIIDEKPFGFTGRYDEYRYIPSTVHGDFKTSLNFWHFGRIFNNLPGLNSEFIQCNPATRPFAVIGNNQQQPDVCRVQVLHSLTAVRPLSKKGMPGLIDHE